MNSFGARLSSFGGSRNIPPAVRAAAAASGASPYEIVSLDFANQQYWRKGVRSSLLDIPGFTASGGVNGTRQTAAGIVLASAPRINTAGSRGLLNGGAATNEILYSGDAFGASWSGNPVGGGFSSVADVDSFLGGTAYRLTGDGSTVSANRNQVFGTLTGASETLSVWLERGNADVSEYGLFDGTASSFVCRGRITWSTLAASVVAGSGTVDVENLGTGPNGGQLVRVTVTATGTAGNARRVFLYPGGTGTFSTNTIIHGAQLEEGSTPSTYIPTAGSAVTRTADSITLDMSDLGLSSDQEWAVTYADGSTGTLNAVADTLTFPASTKVYASAYAVAP